jgi:hypothetical protein
MVFLKVLDSLTNIRFYIQIAALRLVLSFLEKPQSQKSTLRSLLFEKPLKVIVPTIKSPRPAENGDRGYPSFGSVGASGL